MYIPRSTLWVLFILLTFTPSIEEWITADAQTWYRPFIAWAILIFIVFITQQLRHYSEYRRR